MDLTRGHLCLVPMPGQLPLTEPYYLLECRDCRLRPSPSPSPLPPLHGVAHSQTHEYLLLGLVGTLTPLTTDVVEALLSCEQVFVVLLMNDDAEVLINVE